jgi:hypothetical protein
MKTTQFLLLPLLAAILLFAFKPNPADEEAAIKAVIERETETYFKGDLAARNACLTQGASLLSMWADPNGMTLQQGFDAIKKDAEQSFKDNPGPVKLQVAKTNWNIKVAGNVAWATFDQLATFDAAPGFVSNNKEIRCLEKTGGQWRITAISSMETYQVDSPENRAKIQQVCTNETQAWLDADMEKWATTHTQSNDDCLSWNTPDGNFANVMGWQAIKAAVDENAKTLAKSYDKLHNSNFHYVFKGNSAFVSYDQVLTNQAGVPHKSKEHRYLVFNPWAGGWKIQSVLAFHEQNPK